MKVSWLAPLCSFIALPALAQEFNSYVTSSIAQQEIRLARGHNTLPPLPSQQNLISDTVNFNAPDRSQLYQMASLQAHAGYAQLKTACSAMIPAGIFMQFPMNPPAVVEAGRQVVRAGMDHCNDAVGYCSNGASSCSSDKMGYDASRWSARRLADGGALISQMEDQSAPSTAPLTSAPTTGYTWASASSSTSSDIPSQTPPAPYQAQSAPSTTAPPPPPSRPNLVYNGENSSTDPIARAARAALISDSFVKYLDQNGVNGDAFRDEFASGTIQDAAAFLRAAGITNFSDQDLDRATNQARQQFPKLFSNEEGKNAKRENFGQASDKEKGGSLDSDAVVTARVKTKRKENAANDGDTAILDKRILPIPAPPTRSNGALGARALVPDWYQWLDLGVLSSQRARNIFHIAHLQYRNFAPTRQAMNASAPGGFREWIPQ